MMQKNINKRAKIAEQLRGGIVKPVLIQTRVSPALYLEFMNKMGEVGIDCEATALKIAIKNWLGR
jgi:hypothetical protein